MNRQTDARSRRQGVVLLLVLVVVAALSVSVYSFSRVMLTDLAVTKAEVRQSQQLRLAESGIEALLAQDETELNALCWPPEVKVPLSSADSELPIWQRDGDAQQGIVVRELARQGERYPVGLRNESAKLNLNSLTPDRYSRREVIFKLTRYPNLTEAIANNFADQLGIVDESINGEEPNARIVGKPLAGSISAWEQLLGVPGITETLLFGEDYNANGVLDPAEDDGNQSFPPDNRDGVLDAGWIAHWTLTGAESNFRPDGKPKIYLNQPDLVSLYDELIQFATPEQARFVVAWRKIGAIYTDVTADGDRPSSEEIAEERLRTAQERLRAQLGDTNSTAGTNAPAVDRDRDTMRAGLDLGVRPARQFESLLDLASCQIQIIIDGKDTVLVSPFANDPAGLENWLPEWNRQATVTGGAYHAGRINLMQASASTLETVEGISPARAQQIVAQRATVERSATIGWLLESGLLTSAELRKMASEITMRGCVLRGIALGRMDSAPTDAAVAFELDGRGPRFRIRRNQDLAPQKK